MRSPFSERPSEILGYAWSNSRSCTHDQGHGAQIHGPILRARKLHQGVSFQPKLTLRLFLSHVGWLLRARNTHYLLGVPKAGWFNPGKLNICNLYAETLFGTLLRSCVLFCKLAFALSCVFPRPTSFRAIRLTGIGTSEFGNIITKRIRNVHQAMLFLSDMSPHQCFTNLLLLLIFQIMAPRRSNSNKMGLPNACLRRHLLSYPHCV